jgi:hypothetical protein
VLVVPHRELVFIKDNVGACKRLARLKHLLLAAKISLMKLHVMPLLLKVLPLWVKLSRPLN